MTAKPAKALTVPDVRRKLAAMRKEADQEMHQIAGKDWAEYQRFSIRVNVIDEVLEWIKTGGAA